MSTPKNTGPVDITELWRRWATCRELRPERDRTMLADAERAFVVEALYFIACKLEKLDKRPE